MRKEPTFYMALPATEREKLRERQKLRTYREYAKNLTGLDVNRQMNAESEYLIRENQILFRRITNGDTLFLDITPDNFRVLGRLAKRLPRRFRRDITVMSYADLIRGYEYYCQNPPVVKSNQIPLEIEQQIVDIAIENVTWGTPHILHALRNIGNFQLQCRKYKFSLSAAGDLIQRSERSRCCPHAHGIPTASPPGQEQDRRCICRRPYCPYHHPGSLQDDRSSGPDRTSQKIEEKNPPGTSEDPAENTLCTMQSGQITFSLNLFKSLKDACRGRWSCSCFKVPSPPGPDIKRTTDSLKNVKINSCIFAPVCYIMPIPQEKYRRGHRGKA